MVYVEPAFKRLNIFKQLGLAIVARVSPMRHLAAIFCTKSNSTAASLSTTIADTVAADLTRYYCFCCFCCCGELLQMRMLLCRFVAAACVAAVTVSGGR